MPYIPPARKAKAKEVVNFKPVESEFPQLGASGWVKPAWKGRNFATLADDWSKDAKDKKIDAEKEAEKEVEVQFVLPRFNNVRRFVDETEVDAEDEKVAPEWKFVEPRKFHKKKEVDVEILYPELPEETTETVWNEGPAPHETVWDERRS